MLPSLGVAKYTMYMYTWWKEPTVDAQIFVGKIFRGLNFRGEKFSWVVVAHENLTPTKNYLL